MGFSTKFKKLKNSKHNSLASNFVSIAIIGRSYGVLEILYRSVFFVEAQLEGPDYFDEPELKRQKRFIDERIIEKALQFYRSSKKGTRTWESLNNNGFRFIQSRKDIDNFLLKLFSFLNLLNRDKIPFSF